jgi:hypothetical protein
MAYTSRDFMEDLALYSAGATIGVTRSRKFIQYAGRKGIQLAAFGATKVSPPVARGALGVGRATLGAGAALARRNPGVAVGTGLYALNELGYLEEVKDTLGELNQAGMQAIDREFIEPVRVRGRKAKKRTNKFAKAVGAGIKGIKRSTSMGKKGVINAPKKAFTKVTKIASTINKAKKMKLKLPKRPKGKVDRLVYDITKRILG